MNQSFDVDTSFQRIALYAGRHLLPAVALIAFNAAVGLPASVSIGVAAIGIALTSLTLLLRRPGGSQVTITSESLILSKEGAEQKVIPSQLISAVRIKKDIMVVAWRQADRPKSVIFAREYFSEATWQRLSAAVSTLADAIPSVSSTARRFRL